MTKRSNKMTYEERRMKLAFEFDDMENADEYDAAALTIKKQVEALREFFSHWSGYAHSKPQFEQWLIEHGYIELESEENEKIDNKAV